MKPACKQSTAILQKKKIQRNLVETMDICPGIENMILEARTI
jgi:hypothetical protein